MAREEKKKNNLRSTFQVVDHCDRSNTYNLLCLIIFKFPHYFEIISSRSMKCLFASTCISDKTSIRWFAS